MKTLYFFTHSYPYGLGEDWKKDELNEFVKYFDKIIIIPFSDDGNPIPKKVPNKVKVEKPLNLKSIYLKPKVFFKLLNPRLFFYLSDFFYKKVFLKKSRLKRWLSTALQIEELIKHPTIKNVMQICDNSTVLYFYWGRESCDFVNFVNKKCFHKIVVRMHRYDLFEDENENYIPFRKKLLDNITDAAPSSEKGKVHLKSLYPKAKAKIETQRCGTVSIGKSKKSTDNIFRIVTCSYMVPVKRLDIITDALKNMKERIEWTHIGDGPLMEDIKKQTFNFPENLKVKFLGMLKTNEVKEYYINNPVDLFLNVSESEGVPFSIMEALAAGIPVFATNVGGTGEIIDDSVGKILPKELTSDYLSKEISMFIAKSSDEIDKIRINAFKRYSNLCDATVLANEFSKFLIG